jgi:hypothetical protein
MSKPSRLTRWAPQKLFSSLAAMALSLCGMASRPTTGGGPVIERVMQIRAAIEARKVDANRPPETAPAANDRLAQWGNWPNWNNWANWNNWRNWGNWGNWRNG